MMERLPPPNECSRTIAREASHRLATRDLEPPLFHVSAQRTVPGQRQRSARVENGSYTMTPTRNAFLIWQAGPSSPRHACLPETYWQFDKHPSGSHLQACRSSLDRAGECVTTMCCRGLFGQTAPLAPAFRAWSHHAHDNGHNRLHSTTSRGSSG